MTIVELRQRDKGLLKTAVLVYVVRVDRLEFFTMRRRPSVRAEMNARASLRNSPTYLGTVFEEGLLDITLAFALRRAASGALKHADSPEFSPVPRSIPGAYAQWR